MANYNILISSTAEKTLKKVPKSDLLRIINAIQSLATNPLPFGCRKLSGESAMYRVRTGNYRIIYEIESKSIVIKILKIGHRKDVYR